MHLAVGLHHPVVPTPVPVKDTACNISRCSRCHRSFPGRLIRREVLLCDSDAPSAGHKQQWPLRSALLRDVVEVQGAGAVSLESHLHTLRKYYAEFGSGSANSSLLPAALRSAEVVQAMVAHAVNTKSPALRGLQSAVVGSGAVQPLMLIARQGHPIAYEALQILCYRNTITCQQLVADGVLDTIVTTLTQSSIELQCAMCFLLTALVAFSEGSHDAVLTRGLVPQLVELCRTQKSQVVIETSHRHATLQMRAAAVLRNLAHNPRSHSILIQAGAVDALLDIMQTVKDPASRVNAAVAVACLVGHQEEGNLRLQLTAEVVCDMLSALEFACQGSMKWGTFWTVWKLCQGLASLTVNDKNKELITSTGGIGILSEVLLTKHHNNEAAHRYALSALWNLAFNETSRAMIVDTPGLVEGIRNILATTESAKTREVAKGALWTLGLEQDVKSLHEGSGTGRVEVAESHAGAEVVPHVMLSYEWTCQASVMLIKAELQKAGYTTWMDVDMMSGSTLEAMARAVEDSAAVIICVSKRYKESQACRTEAEYAFQQRKKIIPVLMEKDYKPLGWLGALIGTRLYFQMTEARQIQAKLPALMKELGEAGRTAAGTSGASPSQAPSLDTRVTIQHGLPENWTIPEVEDWLKRIRCHEYAATFREKDMDGMALSGLYRMAGDAKFAHEVLQHEFGMISLGQRLRLVEELYKLFN